MTAPAPKLICPCCDTMYKRGERHACAGAVLGSGNFNPGSVPTRTQNPPEVSIGSENAALNLNHYTYNPETHFVGSNGKLLPLPKVLTEGTQKETNPKDAVGIRKVPFSCMSGPVMAEVGLGMLEGACKYGRHNYRVIGVRASVYFDAAQRHLWGWWEGQDMDPDSDIHHVSKLIADLMVLRDAMIRGNWVDDRPPKTQDSWVSDANDKAAAVLDRYPNPKPAYVEREAK